MPNRDTTPVPGDAIHNVTRWADPITCSGITNIAGERAPTVWEHLDKALTDLTSAVRTLRQTAVEVEARLFGPESTTTTACAMNVIQTHSVTPGLLREVQEQLDLSMMDAQVALESLRRIQREIEVVPIVKEVKNADIEGGADRDIL